MIGVDENGQGTLSFGDALGILKAGGAASRSGWNGKGMYIALQKPGTSWLGDKMTLPYIYLRTTTGDFVPWLASQSDMLADDWFGVGIE